MSHEPIKEIPEFDHDVDPMILAKLDEAERYMVTNMSKMRQEQRWIAEKTILAHNLAVEHDVFVKKYSNPISMFFGVLALIGTVIVTVLVEKSLGK